MALTDDLLDLALTRGLVLERVKTAEAESVLKVLRDLEADLVRDLERVDPTGATRTSFQRARLETLLAQARDTIRGGYREAAATAAAGLREVVRAETVWFVKSAEAAVGVDVASTKLSPQQVRAVASDTLIEGAPSRKWWSRQAENTRRSFEDRVRTGMLKGETTPDIVRRVRGTKAAGYSDGIGLHGPGGKAAREAEALVRTSVQTVANRARDATYEANLDVVKGVQWVATLDSRTTPICMALHGKVWSLPDYKPVGHSTEYPGPTAHWGCRSTQVAVFRSWAELSKDRSVPTPAGGRSDVRSMFERELRSMGLSEEKIAKAVFNARASMDGQVARDISFSDWLKGKGESFQDKMLGPGRAELWRKGNISLADLVDQKGRPLSLAELRKL